MKLTKPGVVIDIEQREVARYLRLGYVPFVQERPTKVEMPKAQEPVPAVVEVEEKKPVKKAVSRKKSTK